MGGVFCYNTYMKMKYIVMVDDNFHYMDESERYKAGEYDTYEEAEEKCREIVRRSVEESKYDFDNYTMFGDDPFIIGGNFSAWEYAKRLCISLNHAIE